MVAIEVSRRPDLKPGLSRIGIKIHLKTRILQCEIVARYWRYATRHDTFSNALKGRGFFRERGLVTPLFKCITAS
jgi:hypothetical protein